MANLEKDIRRLIGEVSKPATGEQRERLELACKEYLQNPQINSLRDFSDFANHMQRLYGGLKSYGEFKGVVGTSRPSPLLYESDGTSIDISQITEEDNPSRHNSITTITTTRPDGYTEELSIKLTHAYAPSIELRITHSEDEKPLVHSDIIGNVHVHGAYQGGIIPDPNLKMLQGIKGLAQRIWNAHERGVNPQLVFGQR